MSTPTLMYDRVGNNVVTVDVGILMGTRLLAQANSGGGKSRLIRSLLEQTHGKVQHLVIDSEGEFGTLREKFSYVLASKEGDVPAHPKVAKVLCRRLIEVGASAILDIYDLSLVERREFVKLFLNELMALPRSLWKPVIIVIDEAHNFAPQSGEAQSTDAVIALCTQGRKRGFCAVLATQRISKLHKDAAAELNNKLIGRTGLDVDQKRAGDDLGFDKEQRIALRDLPAGSFWAFGPAMGNGVQLVQTAPVLTTHPDSNTIGTLVVPANSTVKFLVDQIGDLPKFADKERDEKATLEQRVRELQSQLRAKPQHVAQGISEEQVRNRVDTAVADAVERVSDNAFNAGSGAVLDSLRALLDGWQPKTGAFNAPIVARKASPGTSEPQLGKLTVSRSASEPRVSGGVSGPQQRMLDALADFEAIGLPAPLYGHVAVFSNQSPKSSGFDKNLSTLSAGGYVTRGAGKTLSLTDAGRKLAKVVTEPRSLDELHDAWIGYVSGPQQRMLRALLSVRTHVLSFEDLADKSEQSPRSSGYDKNLSTLSSLGLIERRPGKFIALGRMLFPEGLS